MISPHTPPGTPLIVVWVPETLDDLVTTVRPEDHTRARSLLSVRSFKFDIRVGQRVTLDQILPHDFMLTGFLATIGEYPGKLFALEFFDIAQLPRVLTDLQVPELEPA